MELILETRNPGTFTKPWGQTSPKPWLTHTGFFCAACEQASASASTMQWLGGWDWHLSAPLLSEHKDSAGSLRHAKRLVLKEVEVILNNWNNYFILYRELTDTWIHLFPKKSKVASCQVLAPPTALRPCWCLGVTAELLCATELLTWWQKLELLPLELFPSILRKRLAVKWLLLVTEGVGIKTKTLEGQSSWIFISGTKQYGKEC